MFVFKHLGKPQCSYMNMYQGVVFYHNILFRPLTCPTPSCTSWLFLSLTYLLHVYLYHCRTQLIHDLASILMSVPLESLVRPKLPQNTISGHFGRLLNKKQVASLEDKLKVITAESQTVSWPLIWPLTYLIHTVICWKLKSHDSAVRIMEINR